MCPEKRITSWIKEVLNDLGQGYLALAPRDRPPIILSSVEDQKFGCTTQMQTG